MEADTVAHCGTSLMGDFVWSITMTDIFSGWTEMRATWNKGATGVMQGIENIEENLPFEIKGFNYDSTSNGTMARSFLTGILFVILLTAVLKNPYNLPVHVLIKKTIMRTLNKKTGLMFVSSLAIIVLIIQR